MDRMRRASSGTSGLASQERACACTAPSAPRRATTQRESPALATSTARPASTAKQAVVPEREASKPAPAYSCISEFTSRHASRMAFSRRRLLVPGARMAAFSASRAGRRAAASLAAARP